MLPAVTIGVFPLAVFVGNNAVTIGEGLLGLGKKF
jgi:hypothetical protein